MRNRRIHDRVPVAFQVCVTVVTNPELTATGEAQDISSSGLGVFLPIQLVAGSLVRVDIADSVLLYYTDLSPIPKNGRLCQSRLSPATNYGLNRVQMATPTPNGDFTPELTSSKLQWARQVYRSC
jgi:hypothetical protein